MVELPRYPSPPTTMVMLNQTRDVAMVELPRYPSPST